MSFLGHQVGYWNLTCIYQSGVLETRPVLDCFHDSSMPTHIYTKNLGKQEKVCQKLQKYKIVYQK